MTALVQAIIGVATWLGAQFAAQWGLRVGLVAATVTVYAAIWAAIGALTAAAYSAINVSGLFPAFVLQFFPSPSALSAAISIYLGTLATLKAIDHWRSVWTTSVLVK
jgi:hypothetical protein